MALESYTNAPVLSSPSAAWTTLNGAILAGDTSLIVASFASFPSSGQYRILIGDELLIVTAGQGTLTWTVTRAAESTTAAAHANGASIFHTLTAASLLRSPGALTSTGDVPYLASTGAPTRLAAGADGTYLRYASGIPTAAAIVLGDLPSGVGLTASPLSQFAATTSLQLTGVISDETGSGALVFADTPTLIAPLLGTPTSGVLSNCTGLPVGSVTGLGTGVGTFLATPSSANLAAALTDETGSGAAVFATSPTLVTPILGTPQSGTLTNCTLPVGGLTGLGTGVATWFATPSSANLIAAVTDETGTGALVFANTPTLVSPILGTPTSGTLTNCTLPVGGVTGLGTGVATWLATPSSANLASAITDETGSGLLVFGTSPTIVTPTIANFTNATHSHLNAAGGGTITAAAISDLATAAVAFSNKTGNISQWTNDSGYLTSVTAHNVLSATHGDTLAASVTRGDIIIGNSTPKWARLAVGAASRYLSSDGTDVSWGQISLTAGVTGTLPVANGGTGVTASTGTVAVVLSTSPTLVTPVLGVWTSTSGTISPSAATALTITGATETTSQPLISATQTWNASGTTFKAFLLNITNTASATASKLLDLQIGGNTQCYVDRQSSFGVNFPSNQTGRRCYVFEGNGGASWGISRYTDNFAATAQANVISINNAFATDTVDVISCLSIGGNVALSQGGSAVLQLGRDTNGAAVSQTLQAANGITGTDKTGGNLTLASGKGTGAGAVSSLIFQTPTVLASGTTAQTLSTRVTIDSSGLTFADAMNVVVNATTGTKVGTATSQKLGFWNATPIIQPAAAGQASITDSTGGIAASSLVDVGVVFSQAAINANFATVAVLLLAIRTALVNSGLMKGAA